MSRSLAFVARAAGGRLQGDDREFAGVSTDSRTIAAGELFFALRGERFDGHEFVAAAAARGAAGAVVDHALPVALSQVVVADTTVALGQAAQAWRDRFSLPVVGVGGSNGKTTTKEMVAAILAELGPGLATRGNLNNHIGVPLTLFRLEAAHRTAVVEMGANHAGEIAALVAMARPTVGLVTNAGAEHLEGFGSLEGVARAEGEMFAGLDAGATAVINADDAFAGLWRSMSTGGRRLTFGLSRDADFRGSEAMLRIADDGFATEFVLDSPAGRAPVRLGLAGRHNVMNALGAAAAAYAAGASLGDIVRGLARVRPVAGRLELKRAASGAWIVDDSYNANPNSVCAGIDVLGGLPGAHWLVLGVMAELGEHSAASHADVGRYAREHGVSRLLALGPDTREAVAAFGPRAEQFGDVESLTATLLRELPADATVLVKGSRVNRLERVVQALVAAPPMARAG